MSGMEQYIRLQKKAYDINENTRSFEWGFGNGESDMHEAMKEEISILVEPLTDLDIEGLLHAHQKEQLERANDIDNASEEEIEALYEELGGTMVLNGVSCYENDEDGAEELLSYFEERSPEALESNDFYVLIFEGEDEGEGHNGENVARWQKDVERVETKEFFARYG